MSLAAIALDLKLGHSESILCEGCNIRPVYKDEKGLIYLGRKFDQEIAMVSMKIEELGMTNSR